VDPVLSPIDPTVRRTWRARLVSGPVGRRIALVDLRLFRLVRRAQVPSLHGPISRFSHLGQHGALWLALGALGALVDRSRRSEWLRGALVVLLVYGLNTAVKGVVRRSRPDLADLPALVPTPTALSFPSAHASSSFAAARAYSSLVPGLPLYGVACAMAISRVYLGVHYPSDIAAGAGMGLLLGGAGRSA
jgi:undecaprenyl-diphosphatase